MAQGRDDTTPSGMSGYSVGGSRPRVARFMTATGAVIMRAVAPRIDVDERFSSTFIAGQPQIRSLPRRLSDCRPVKSLTPARVSCAL
jgi:hypothetical protein